MMRSPNPAYRSFNRFQRSLLVPGLSCLAGVGLLSSFPNGAHAAQTTSDITIAPSPEAAPLPDVVSPEPLELVTPETLPSAPEAIPTAPIGSNDNPIVELQRPTPSNNYEAPSTIILTERSSGCQAVLGRGQGVSGELCPPPPSVDRSFTATSHAAGGQRFAGSYPSRVSVGGVAGSSAGSSWQAYYKVTSRPRGRVGNNLSLLFPLPIPTVITSAFGWRIHPISGDRRFHSGTDLGAPMGTPVLAAYAGRVAVADFLGGYGLTVAIDHKKGDQQTLYAHLSEIFVRPGEWVPQGTVIGRVGSTGNSTGPHLHFELREATADGWVALDAGMQLEYALAQLVKSLQVAQAPSRKS
jgi:murein DD-endopeptidase MepM/ murein hydrolase activator NlpD